MTNDESGIDYREGSVTIYGPDGMAFYRAVVIANALRLYAKTKMRANRAYTPTAMMQAASAITGQKFKPRDYLGAASALDQWALTMKAGLPKTKNGEPIA